MTVMHADGGVPNDDSRLAPFVAGKLEMVGCVQVPRLIGLKYERQELQHPFDASRVQRVTDGLNGLVLPSFSRIGFGIRALDDIDGLWLLLQRLYYFLNMPRTIPKLRYGPMTSSPAGHTAMQYADL